MFDSYAAIFEQRAGSYHSAMRKWPRARDAEFRSVLDPLESAPHGLVCDMPSGGGYLADHLPPGFGYVGVDPADDFIQACEGKSVVTVNAPIVDVPLADGSVDYVVSLAGLHHEETLARVFGEMRRLLKPGGRAVISDVAIDSPPARFLNGYVARHNPQGHDGRFLDEETGSLLATAGLRVVTDELTSVPWAFGTVEEAGAFCWELFGVFGASPQAVGEALAAEIGFREENGGVQLQWALRRIVCEVPIV